MPNCQVVVTAQRPALPAAQAWGVSSRTAANVNENVRRMCISGKAVRNLACGGWLEKRPARPKFPSLKFLRLRRIIMSRPKALITGASTGIGKTYAQRLARRGYDLVLVARDRERLEELAKELRHDGAASEVLVADLTQSSDVVRVEQKLEGDPAISFFLNNAGIATIAPQLQTPVETIEKLIALTVTAANG